MYKYEYRMSDGGQWYSRETFDSITDALDFGWHYADQRTKALPEQGTVVWVEATKSEE